MHYEESLRYIHAAPHFKGKASRARMEHLCALLGNPQQKLRMVHVAGTNGKGSTVNMIAAALTASGYRTGMFTSPYVLDFCERIQVDFCQIPHAALARIADQVCAADAALARTGENATEFELVTACGLLWFCAQSCDVVVLEVGLGGRFDATNVIPPPLCAVITKIALDHTRILGDTLGEIAFEKCGIFKGGDAVCYPRQDPQALAVIRRRADETGTTLHIPQEEPAQVLACTLDCVRLWHGGAEWMIPLGGEHQVYNALCALETLDVLRTQGFDLPQERVYAGIAQLRFPARLERVRETPRVYIDGAHNPDGMAALCAALDASHQPVTAVFAAMSDKDYHLTASMIARRARRFIACGLAMPRAASPEALLEAVGDTCAVKLCASDCTQALRMAFKGLPAGEAVMICGSLYLASEARRILCPKALFSDEKTENSYK